MKSAFAKTLASALGLLALKPTASHAQTVDYGALEKLFGEPVTTSATGSPQRVSEVPVDMEIVTADDIRRSGAIDLPGVLRHVEGVDVLQWTNSDADVGVRGYNQPYSSRLLVLIDGRQVYADYYGFTPWSALPVELGAIRQIEVVKGPNSALFGFNAVGGVINIITTNPLDDAVNSVSFGVGTQGLAQASAVSTFKIDDRAGIRIEAGGRSNDEFSTPITNLDARARRGDNRGSIDVDGLVQLADDVQFGLEASHTRAAEAEMFPTLYTLGYTNYSTSSVKGQLTADTALGLVQATTYSNWIHAYLVSNNDTFNLATADRNPTIPSAELALLSNNQVTVVQLQDIFKLGSDHTFRGSFEYRHNSVNTTPTPGGTVFYDVVTGSAMWDWKATPTVSVTNALRVDRLMLGREGFLAPGTPFTNASWNRTITEPSFNSGLVWQPDDLDTIRLTASRGVQLPNLEDLGGVQDVVPDVGIPTVTLGIPSLSPTSVLNYEIGWDRSLPMLGATLRVSLYMQNTDRIVSNIGAVWLLPGALTITSANIGDSSANGAEIGLKGHLAPNWRWGLSYTREIISDHFTPNPFSRLFPVDYQHTMPVHVVDANLGWTAGRWEIDGFLRYESRFYGLASAGSGTSLMQIGDFVSIDGRIGYKPTDWAILSLSGQNIGQSSQRQTAAPNVERRVTGAISASF